MFYCQKQCQRHFFCIRLLAAEILFCFFVDNLILFCVFVDAGQREGSSGFECK